MCYLIPPNFPEIAAASGTERAWPAWRALGTARAHSSAHSSPTLPDLGPAPPLQAKRGREEAGGRGFGRPGTHRSLRGLTQAHSAQAPAGIAPG